MMMISQRTLEIDELLEIGLTPNAAENLGWQRCEGRFQRKCWLEPLAEAAKRTRIAVALRDRAEARKTLDRIGWSSSAVDVSREGMLDVKHDQGERPEDALRRALAANPSDIARVEAATALRRSTLALREAT